MRKPDTYEDFKGWFEVRYAGPGSVTVGEACREFTGTSIPVILQWWQRFKDEGKEDMP
jgi:hypothetical protein